MTKSSSTLKNTLPKDLLAGLVVSLVALPLCLGIAQASGAPLISGLISGIIGGIVVGWISQSNTSVSGPAAGLTAVVAAQITQLGSFEAFLLAVVLAGVIQIFLGIFRAGFISAFFPLSVIKGLLAAIGIIIILKQIPHLIGDDLDPMGEKAFFQPDGKNTFSELLAAFADIQHGALVVGLLSLAILIGWDKIKVLKKSVVPAALIVVIVSVSLNKLFQMMGSPLTIDPSHLVTVPVTAGAADFAAKALLHPNWSFLSNPAIYTSAITLAIVASLETLLNIEAVDKIDPKQQSTPPNRELLAQGIGNVLSGLVGGLPMTSVIVRSSANITAKAETKISAIWHGTLLLVCVMAMPTLLNMIPLSALAAVLIMIGLKLASPKLIKEMWSEGKNQFLPFIITILAIVFTDLLTGVLIGLAIAIGFILHSNARRPLRKIMEKHVGGDVMRIVLSNQVSFLSRSSLQEALRSVPRGGHIMLDAQNTEYMDPDVRDLITDFRDTTSKALGVELSFTGFKDHYPELEDRVQFVDFSSREVQAELTPEKVLKILREGNERFLGNTQLTRDHLRLVDATSAGQFPMAAVLGCIDSRAPAEVIFDLSLGDIFSARVAGNIATEELLGSLEFACAVMGSKLIVVMGHTSCGAVNAAVDLLANAKKASEATPCGNLDSLITEIQQAINPAKLKESANWTALEKVIFKNEIARASVIRTISVIRQRSKSLDKLVNEGKIAIVGCLYDVKTGTVNFYQSKDSAAQPLPVNLAPLA